jgi:uncharacterized protein DUF4157
MSFQERTRARVVSAERLARLPSSPLAPDLRTMMEARFGRDFGGVRLHTGKFAEVSAGAIGARAYTCGAHIVFGRGCYDPDTREGLWLLAHELCHVIQQSGEASVSPGIADADDLLERAADHAADLVAANRALPRDFAFGSAAAGAVQRHAGPPCAGFGVTDADAILTQAAERRLELAYDGRAGAYGDVLYGSNNFQPPNGYRAGGGAWGPFVDDLVNFLRQRPIGERPNIVSLQEREVYFFRRQFEANPGLVRTIGIFHGNLDRFLRRHNMATWDSAESNWFPDHTLPFIGDPAGRFVCTQATDHIPPRGLILYDIRSQQRRRRARRAVSFELWTADSDMAQFFPHLREALPKAVHTYDPENSNFVFIVPADFYHDWYKQTRSNKIWDFHTVKPSYDFPGGQAVKEMRSRLHHASLLIGVVAFTVIVVGTIVFAAAVLPAVAATGAGATTGAAAGASAGAAAVSLPASSTIIVPAGIAAQVAAAGSTAAATAAAGGGVTTAMWALAAAPAAKTVLAATAGVLLVIGTVKNANAGTGRPDKPVVSKVSAFRAVAIDDFKPVGNTQAAVSNGPPANFSHTPETAKGKFNVGTKVLFDNVPHIIIGGFSVS